MDSAVAKLLYSSYTEDGSCLGLSVHSQDPLTNSQYFLLFLIELACHFIASRQISPSCPNLFGLHLRKILQKSVVPTTFAPTGLKPKFIVTFWRKEEQKRDTHKAANNRICGLCLFHATPDSASSHLSFLGGRGAMRC